MSSAECEAAIEYITTLKGGSINPGLERIADLLKAMGNPEKDLRFVHVAGTNGKGSTLAFLFSVLSEAGYKVGSYTSPAVFNYRERYRTGKRIISEKDFVKGTEIVRAAAERMAKNGLDTPSAFEAETALAFWYFKEKACDIVLLETGMGGRLDATNVIPAPLAAVIASISYDHMNFLGDTLEKIASEKAGIIKPGSAVVSAKQHEEAGEVIKKAAEAAFKSFDKTCGYYEVDESAIKDRKVAKGSLYQLFDYKEFKKIRIGLAGKYQLKNAALAIEAVFALRDKGLKISDTALYRGLENAVWPGRFQRISDKPCVIVDGAHNEEAAERLAESIDYYFTNRNIVYIMGMLKDKEYEKVSRITAEKANCIFTVTTPNNPRALNAIELAETVRHFNKNVTAADSIEEAYEMAKMVAGPGGVVIIFGSLSFLGRIMELAENGSGKDKTGR